MTGMKKQCLRLLALVSALAIVACGGDHSTSTTGGSLAQLQLGGPSGPVTSGTDFTIDIKARDIGFSVLHNTRVHLVLPPPLVVTSGALTSGSGTFVFTNSVNGATGDFMLGTLSQNSESDGTIHANGILTTGMNNVTVKVTAEMTSDEVHAGSVDANVNVIIQQ
jgi:hypothetical protein